MLVIFLMMTASLGATSSDMATAADVPAADIITSSLDGSPLAVEVESALGIILPTAGSDMAHLYTGRIGTPPQTGTDLGSMGPNGDDTHLIVQLNVPATANSLSFDFYFLSAEYPEWVGTKYNDTFEANVAGSAWSGNAAIDAMGNQVSINSVLFDVTASPDLAGSGYDSGVGGGTGWLTVLVPVDPSTVLDLDFQVYDEYDGIYDSSVLLDNFQWSESDIPEPFIIETIRLDYLVPKRGSVEGGDETVLYGDKFNATCYAIFDGVDALKTEYIDTSSLRAMVPAHAEGLVNVEVQCTGTDAALVGGYTYYNNDDGELPPLLSYADPYVVSGDGGEQVTLLGEDFVDGATVKIDGKPVDVVYVDSTQLVIETKEHDEGSVGVEVKNPSGLSDYKEGALLYMAVSVDELPEVFDTAVPEEEPEPDASRSGTGGCDCATGGVAGIGWLVAFGAIASIRRRRS